MSYVAPPGGFRTFLILWASQSFSVFGTALTLFAINIWLVKEVYPLPEQQPQLAWSLAAVGLAMGLSSIATAPIAGAMADRMDRKRLMLATDLLNAAVMGGVAYLAGAGILEVWMVLVAAAWFGMTGAIHGSAFDTSYAMLVNDDQLPRANGMMQTMWSLSSVLSPAIAATIIALPIFAREGRIPGAVGELLEGLHSGVPLVLGIDAVTFLLAALVLSFLSIPSPRRTDLDQKGGRRSSIWADVKFGVVYIWRRKPLFWLLITYAVVNLCLPLGVFLPLIVKVDLAADWAARGFTYETALAAINTALAVGGLAGGVLISLWGGAKRKRIVVLLLSIAAGSVAQITLGLAPTLYVAIGAAFLLNFGIPIGNAHSQAIWQSQVPREMQGRVFAVRRVMAQSLAPLGQVLAGWLAGSMDPGTGLALLGGIVLLVSVGQLFNPLMMRVEDKAYLDRMAAEG